MSDKHCFRGNKAELTKVEGDVNSNNKNKVTNGGGTNFGVYTIGGRVYTA